MQRIETAGTTAGRRYAQTSFVAAEAMPRQFPEIEAATGLISSGGTFRKDGEPITIEDVYFTDGNFLDVIRLPMVAGDPATALDAVDSVVLTETTARRLFGRTDVLGRTVTRIAGSGDKVARVTGILRDLPANSHLRVAALYRPNLASSTSGNEAFTQWNWVAGWVYVRLRPGVDPAAMHRRMNVALRRLVPSAQRDASAPDGLGFTQELMNIRAINTGAIDAATMRLGTPMKTLVTFGIVAAFLLVVACVNFTNLATARASRRAREVGLRKTLGASRGQLIAQFLIEAVVVVAAAGLLAIALVELALPWLNAQIDGGISVRYFGADGIILPLAGLLAIVGIMGGVYPAFFLSRYRPALVLKANQSAADTPGAGRLRTGLVVLQFAVSIALIICTAIIYAQTLVRALGRSRLPGARPAVRQLSRADRRPRADRDLHAPGRRRPRRDLGGAGRHHARPRHHDGLDLARAGGAGQRQPPAHRHRRQCVPHARHARPRRPDGDRPARDGRRRPAVRPRSGARADGRTARPQRGGGRERRPASRLCQPAGGGRPADRQRQVRRSGSSSPIRSSAWSTTRASLRRASRASPKSITSRPSYHSTLAVRFEGVSGASVMPAIEALWKSSVNTAPFEGFFADARIAEMYDADERRARMFAIFAAFAVLISCLGLFGLAAFTAQHRTKEIGIRKVLGARTRDIIRLLVWQFTRPVLLANLIAWPIAWWAMRDWLSEFESRIEIGPTPFVVAGLLALAIAAGTIAGHAMRVARANPIHALRYE